MPQSIATEGSAQALKRGLLIPKLAAYLYLGLAVLKRKRHFANAVT